MAPFKYAHLYLLSSGDDGDDNEDSPLTRMLGGRLAVLFLLAFCTFPPPPAGFMLNRAEEEKVRGRL